VTAGGSGVAGAVLPCPLEDGELSLISEDSHEAVQSASIGFAS
jgi:hypothetical protein